MDNTLTEGISLNRGLSFFCGVHVNFRCTTIQTLQFAQQKPLNLHNKNPTIMPVMVEYIIDTVCQQSAVTKDLLLSKDRRKFIVDAKQIIIFALTEIGFTQQFIAEQLNYKDHTTIHHHLKRDCPVSHENRRRATRVVKQCDYMASIEKSRYESNMEEFLEKVQQIR